MYEYHGNKGSRRQQEIKEPLTLYRAGGFLFISCRRYQTDHLQIYSGGVRILNVQLENGEIEPYSIDDVIDIVCEWNYELILDAEAHRSDPKDFNDYNEYQSRYESLKADEKRLDRLFDKTSYGKELIEVATELADRVIAQLGNKELEKAAVTVAEGVREYSTGKRGR